MSNENRIFETPEGLHTVRDINGEMIRLEINEGCKINFDFGTLGREAIARESIDEDQSTSNS